MCLRLEPDVDYFAAILFDHTVSFLYHRNGRTAILQFPINHVHLAENNAGTYALRAGAEPRYAHAFDGRANISSKQPVFSDEIKNELRVLAGHEKRTANLVTAA